MTFRHHLASWIIALASFIGLQSYIYLDADQSLIDYQINRTMDQIIAACHAREANELVVVTVGNSLLNHGVHCRDQFDQIVSTRTSKNISLFKVTRSGGNFASLIDRNDLIKKLIDARPDLILIQDEMMITSRTNDHILYDGQSKLHWSQWKDAYFKLAFMNVNFGMSVADRFRNKEYCLNSTFNKTVSDSLDYQNNFSAVRSWNDDPKITMMWSSLKASGIDTKLIEIPRPPDQTAIHQESFSAKFVNKLDELKTTYQVDYWHYQGPQIPFSMYYDRAHLNQLGRERYSAWLAEQLIEYKGK